LISEYTVLNLCSKTFSFDRLIYLLLYSGGTITVASVKCPWCHRLAADEVGFEDGTINYLNLPAVEIGLKHIQ